jgi:hypothetical protein
MIPTYKFSESELKGFEEYLSKQVIAKNPTNNLRNIYERRILYEISYLRAEKYDSPENAEELRELQIKNKSNQIPRGVQNKNFDTLLKYHSKLLESPSEKPPYPALSIKGAVKLLEELNGFVCGFYQYVKSDPVPVKWKFEPKFLESLPDPRCVQGDPNMFFCYLLTRFKQNLEGREVDKFNKLTNNGFDKESVKMSLEQMRGVLMEGDLVTYQEFTKEISGLDWDVKVVGSKEVPEDCENMKDFFDYLYLTYYN